MKSLNLTVLCDGFSCPAPAKLNLFLHITGQRDDGYHLLQTIFQFIDISDTLTFRSSTSAGIELEDGLHDVPQTQNLIYRAARLLQDHAGIREGVNISLEKNLPMGAGLGGGSSDAATTLVALNHFWRLGIPPKELLALGGKLGADVPVFIHGDACWAEGTGDRFQSIELPEPWYLLLKPMSSVSTAEMFSAPELTRNCSPITIRDFLAGRGSNVFEPVVRQRHPQVAAALDWLREKAADLKTDRVALGKVAMSGTGSCVFMACASQQQAQTLAETLPAGLAADCERFVTRAHNLSPLYQHDVQ